MNRTQLHTKRRMLNEKPLPWPFAQHTWCQTIFPLCTSCIEKGHHSTTAGNNIWASGETLRSSVCQHNLAVQNSESEFALLVIIGHELTTVSCSIHESCARRRLCLVEAMSLARLPLADQQRLTTDTNKTKYTHFAYGQ